MSTCAACHRTEATARQHREVADGDALVDVKLCWSTWQRDPFCDQLAADLGRRADAELLAAARCFPPGVLAKVAAVLRAGGADRGVEPHQTGGGQTREDHLRHAIDHVYGAAMGDESEPHVDHAIARLALARGPELATAGGSGQ